MLKRQTQSHIWGAHVCLTGICQTPGIIVCLALTFGHFNGQFRVNDDKLQHHILTAEFLCIWSLHQSFEKCIEKTKKENPPKTLKGQHISNFRVKGDEIIMFTSHHLFICLFRGENTDMRAGDSVIKVWYFFKRSWERWGNCAAVISTRHNRLLSTINTRLLAVCARWCGHWVRCMWQGV